MESLITFLFENTLFLTFLAGFLALILIPGLIALLLIWGVSRYNRMIKALAAEQNWRYRPKLGILLAGHLPNRSEWQLTRHPGDDYNYRWQAPLQTDDDIIWISTRTFGVWHSTAFSKTQRYHVGSSQLQKRYFLAATSEQLLCQLLTPEVETMLLTWPRYMLFSHRTLKVLLKNDRLVISTQVNNTVKHITKIVQLGTSLVAAYKRISQREKVG